ncbi:DUF6302 family protein [Streptomyces sp. NPDC055089]
MSPPCRRGRRPAAASARGQDRPEGGGAVISTYLVPPVRQDLGVRLLTPEKACDFEYWAARLIHPELSRDAVAVALYRLPLPAIPAGMERRGGRLDMGFASCAKLAAREFRCRPGFHSVAAVGTDVVWGEPAPEDGATEPSSGTHRDLRTGTGHHRLCRVRAEIEGAMGLLIHFGARTRRPRPDFKPSPAPHEHPIHRSPPPATCPAPHPNDDTRADLHASCRSRITH